MINQVSFYATRLRQENFTRRLGMVFAILGMLVQSLVIFSPAQSTLAASTNDIVYGGIGGGLRGETPQQTMLRIYDANTDTRNNDIQEIYAHFGVTRSDIANSTLTNISSADRSLHSLGRENKHAVDRKIPINGKAYYLRPLYVWDVVNPTNTYQALKIPNKQIWIMVNCGNIVVKLAEPKPEIAKTSNPAPGTPVKPGDIITYTLSHGNAGTLGIDQYVIEDVTHPWTTYKSHFASNALRSSFTGGPVPGVSNDIPHAWWTWTTYAPGRSGKVTLTVVVNEKAQNGSNICNTAYIRGNGVAQQKSTTICHPVKIEQTPPNLNIAIDKTVVSGSNYKIGDNVTYRVKVTNTGSGALGRIFVRDEFPAGLINGQALQYIRAIQSLAPGESTTFDYTVKVTKDATPVITNTACAAADDGPRACDSATINVPVPTSPTPQEPTPRQVTPPPAEPEITLSKSAIITTAPNGDDRANDAHNKTANPGDVIRYKLLTSNGGGSTQKNYLIQEDLSDVLEYATLTNAGGGKLNEDGIITWPETDIKANETIKHEFEVTVLATVPSTPQSTSDPDSFDLTMNNVYGNEVTIKVKPPAGKVPETTVKKLPNTGVGENIAFTVFFVMIVVYFYNRNKQLLEEIKMLKKDYSHGV